MRREIIVVKFKCKINNAQQLWTSHKKKWTCVCVEEDNHWTLSLLVYYAYSYKLIWIILKRYFIYKFIIHILNGF